MYLACWQNPDGAMKLKKLKKFVVKSLKASGCAEDKNEVTEMIEKKVSILLFLALYFCLGDYYF